MHERCELLNCDDARCTYCTSSIALDSWLDLTLAYYACRGQKVGQRLQNICNRHAASCLRTLNVICNRETLANKIQSSET